MSSRRFNLLSRRIRELRIHLLPSRFDPLGFYSDRIYDRTRAFRILSHAEFESYIEDRALEVLNNAFNSWQTNGRVRPCLLALLAYGDTSPAVPNSLLSPPQKRSPDLAARIEKEKNNYNHYIRMKNNGIKEKDLLQILMPIGFLENEIEVAWLNTVEGWATQRGETAHKTGKVQVQIDPEHEYDTVREILRGFRGIDVICSKK